MTGSPPAAVGGCPERCPLHQLSISAINSGGIAVRLATVRCTTTVLGVLSSLRGRPRLRLAGTRSPCTNSTEEYSRPFCLLRLRLMNTPSQQDTAQPPGQGIISDTRDNTHSRQSTR